MSSLDEIQDWYGSDTFADSNAKASDTHGVGSWYGDATEALRLYGGFSYSDNSDINQVSNNVVEMNTGTVNQLVYGGYSAYGNAEGDSMENGNRVKVSNNAVIKGNTSGKAGIYGGYVAYTEGGNANCNTVEITGGTIGTKGEEGKEGIAFEIAGGFTATSKPTASVSSNAVIISGGGYANSVSVYGGHATENAEASNNTVEISANSQTFKSVFGGYSLKGSANGNSVTIHDANVSTYVVGGSSWGNTDKSVACNQVTIEGGSFNAKLIAGAYTGATAQNNIVRLVGGTFNNNVLAGADSVGNALNNVVEINGMSSGSVCRVYGGYSHGLNANNNTVILNEGKVAQVEGEGGSVYGGYVNTNGATANYNAVIWKAGTVERNIYGGENKDGTASIGNTLAVIGAKPYLLDNNNPPNSLGYSVLGIYRVQNYLFVINDKSVIQTGTLTADEGQVMLKVKSDKAPTLSSSDHVAVTFADGFDVSQVSEGSKTVLMNVDANPRFITTDADTLILDLEDGGNTYAAATLAKSVSKVNEYDFEISSTELPGYLVAILNTIAPNDLTLSTRDIGYANLVNFRSQMNDVALRMGELRTSKNAGGWARIYGGTYSFGEGRKDKSFTLQVGADRWFDANSYVGVMGSYTKAEDTLTNGENDQKNWNVGFYGGYVADSGLFWDATVRHGKIENKYNLSSLTPVSGKYSTYGTSASVEGGWRFDCPSTNFYVEPQGELMYGHMQSVTYNAGDVTIKNDAVNTFVGRVGVAAGYKFAEDQGNLYLRTSLLHDFKGKVKTQAVSGNETDGGFTKDFGGTWGEFVLGGNYKATKSLNLYGEMMCSTKNAGVRTKWQGSIGARWTF